MYFLSNNEDVRVCLPIHRSLEFQSPYVVCLSESVHEVSNFIDDADIASPKGCAKVAVGSGTRPSILI